MKEKLKVTNIAGIKLEEEESGEKIRFRNLFTFKNFLGTGGFGFVVSADNLETGETIAIKVSLKFKLKLSVDRGNQPVKPNSKPS